MLIKEDIEFLDEIFENDSLLFYGEFEEYLNNFLQTIFKNDLKRYGFEEIKTSDEFRVAYWFLLSWLDTKNMFEYGTSPRGGWLTEKGERFKQLVITNDNVLDTYQEIIYSRYN